MQTYATLPVVVNPQVDEVDEIIRKSQAAAAEMTEAYKELSDRLQSLINRMHAAMAEIAEAAGAFSCPSCGEYTLDTIEVADYSEELGREVNSYCQRCVPAGCLEVA